MTFPLNQALAVLLGEFDSEDLELELVLVLHELVGREAEAGVALKALVNERGEDFVVLREGVGAVQLQV